MGRKALLIGINYVGTQNELRGCHQDVQNMKQFLQSRGFDEGDMVVLTDAHGVSRNSPSYPSGQNIIRALNWLVTHSDNCSLFMHYSGHGGQVPDPDGSGIDDTICPVDFAECGQINSDVLHQVGTVLELPYTYRTDEDGNVDLVDNIKQGIQLAAGAAHLLQGGFTMGNIRDAEVLYAGARSFFKGLQHMGNENEEEGLGQAEGDYQGEGAHRVIMYSGCRDDQTSADASIAGGNVGAMSWAFLKVMAENDGQQSYVDILRNTRGILQQNYSQIPQLSCGEQIDLDRTFEI